MNAAALHDHLATGSTHVCHCWAIKRRDGVTLGFTDHDGPLEFDGITFSPQSGLSSRALASTSGLSVNNTEAIGVLSANAITEADIDAGRYDGAEVTNWMVQWDHLSARQVRFVGTVGEISRFSGGFQVELRGMTDALNQPQGRAYLKTCSAILGDAGCQFDLATPGFAIEAPVASILEPHVFRFPLAHGFNDRWFEGGTIEALSGAAAGLMGVIKHDVIEGADRVVTLWEELRGLVVVGDRVRLVAGCDKRSQTCREKFSNIINYQGFPDIPGNDWLTSIPRAGGGNTGSSRRT